MCDPISMIGLAVAVGSAAMNYSAQQDYMSKQQAANDAWLAYQQRQSQQELQRDEQLRQQAEAAREQSLQQLTPAKQKEAQTNEQARLQKTLTPDQIAKAAGGDRTTLNDMLLSGQQNTAAPVQQGIQSQIADAAQAARDRINALATVLSYGGSQYGLTNRANTIFNAAGQDIRLAGDERQGSLAAYNVSKQVQPIQYQMQPNPFGGVANAAAGAVGKGLGSMMAGAV
jgi:hypothetical protein